MMDWGTPVSEAPAASSDWNDKPDGVMIALIPDNTEWCKLKCPHLTLVYAGTVDKLKPTDFNELGKEASDLSVLSRPITLKVSGTEEFGGDTADNPPVEVFTLQSTPELRAMRRAVEHWNVSEWPFTPHVTIGPRGTLVDVVPTMLRFSKLMVAWGDQELIFNLGGF